MSNVSSSLVVLPQRGDVSPLVPVNCRSVGRNAELERSSCRDGRPDGPSLEL